MSMSEPEETTDPPETDGSEDVDGIDPDDFADLGEVAEEIEGSTTDDSGGDEEIEEETTSVDHDREEISPGRVYTNLLGVGAAEMRENFGSDPGENAKDDYAELARDLEIDRYADKLVKESGGIESLEPEQALLLTTLLFGGLVIADDPAMIDGIRNGSTTDNQDEPDSDRGNDE